jgi:hypothetical protein
MKKGRKPGAAGEHVDLARPVYPFSDHFFLCFELRASDFEFTSIMST